MLHRRPDLDVAGRALDAAIFSLPVLATVALYLPSGVLMPVRLVTVALAIVAGWRAVLTRRVPCPRGLAVLLSVGGVLVVAGIVAMLRYPGRTSVTEAVQLGYLLVLCVAVALLAASRRRMLALVWGWLAAGVVAAAVGVWEVITAQHLPKHAPAQMYAGKLEGWNDIASFFDNPNLYAYQIVVVLLVFPVLWASWKGWTRWALVPLALLFAYLLYRTDGRMAILTLCVGVAVWCVASRWGRIAAGVAVAGTAVTMLLKVPPGKNLLDFVLLATDNIQWAGTSTWVRAEMARSGWWMLEQSHYLGVGPGGYATWALDPANPHRYQKLNNAHWGMVEVVAEYGILGLGVLLAALAVVVVVGVKAFRARPAEGDASRLDQVIALASVVLAGTLPLISIAHSTWLRQPLTAVHVATLVGLALYTCHKRAASHGV